MASSEFKGHRKRNMITTWFDLALCVVCGSVRSLAWVRVFRLARRELSS
jgi:hypothetical protein